jgi:SAM-dependent methyltransferase
MITYEQQQEWSHVPVDDVGYFHSRDLLAKDDAELRQIADAATATRYNGWRNHGGLWAKAMNLDSVQGAHVLDFGCGLGTEAVQYAMAGAQVSLADISSTNVLLARRVMGLYGYRPRATWVLRDDPMIPGTPWFDVVHASGVLHHIPEPVPAVGEIAEWLEPGGQMRIMVYSDEGWRIATGTNPPANVRDHPSREKFVRFFDAVGNWADWYSEARLATRFGRWFDVTDTCYITPDRRYLTATLRRRGGPAPG